MTCTLCKYKICINPCMVLFPDVIRILVLLNFIQLKVKQINVLIDWLSSNNISTFVSLTKYICYIILETLVYKKAFQLHDRHEN